MHIPWIAAGAVAAAVVLNPGAAFAQDNPKPTRTNAGQEGITIEGRLVSLHAYLEKGDRAISTGTDAASPPPARPDASRQATPAALGQERSDSPLAGTRDQADREASRLASPANARHNQMNPESPNSAGMEILVLIAQHSGIHDPPAGATRSIPGQAPFGQPRVDPKSLPGSAAHTEGGKAYILVFGDDSSGRTAYSKASGMITDGSLNWSAGQRNPSVKGSMAPSQVKITGRMMSRGGIQAIQVSGISLASSLPSDPARPTPGDVNRVRANLDNEKRQK